MLTIQEITHEKFPEKVKNIHKKIEKAFKKKKYSNKFLEYLDKNSGFSALFIYMCAAIIIVVSIATSLFLLLILAISAILSIILSIKIDIKEEKKLKNIEKHAFIQNIIRENKSDNKVINKDKMLKIIKSFNEKEKNIINEINITPESKNADEIVFNILERKVKRASVDEIELEKKYITNYIERNKDNKYGVRIEFLLKEKAVEEKSIYNNNIVNMI